VVEVRIREKTDLTALLVMIGFYLLAFFFWVLSSLVGLIRKGR